MTDNRLDVAPSLAAEETWTLLIVTCSTIAVVKKCVSNLIGYMKLIAAPCISAQRRGCTLGL